MTSGSPQINHLDGIGSLESALPHPGLEKFAPQQPAVLFWDVAAGVMRSGKEGQGKDGSKKNMNGALPVCQAPS